METQNEVSTEIIEQEKQVVAQIVAEAEAVVIKTEQENQVVANKIVGYRDALKRVEEKVMAGPRETKRQATTTVSNLEALFIKPIEQALKLLRDKSARFYAAEEARRAELQRKEDA
jgi:prenyltransferase beta subunit